MNMRELLTDWAAHSHDRATTARLCVGLSHQQLAHILALTDIFPGHSQEQIVTDLLAVALEELETTLPYIKGERVIAEDEFGDPVYEDIGMTPRFLELSQKYLQQLDSV